MPRNSQRSMVKSVLQTSSDAYVVNETPFIGFTPPLYYTLRFQSCSLHYIRPFLLPTLLLVKGVKWPNMDFALFVDKYSKVNVL